MVVEYLIEAGHADGRSSQGSAHKELGEGAEPPAGEAPWNRFFDLLRPETLLGSGSKPRRTLREAVELVSNLGASRKCPLKVVPNLGARCAAPWKWFQTPFPGVAALWK